MIIEGKAPIHIAGSGIAGMTAAINLSTRGKTVIIHEKHDRIGGSRDGDFEGLENWIFTHTVPEFFSICDVDFNALPATPIFYFKVHVRGLKPVRVTSPEPFFYIVSRGTANDSIDNYMANICRANKVQFNFGKAITQEDADIYAVGKGRAAAFIQGATIRTDQPDQVHLLLGKTFAPSGYAYLIINGGCGTIATAYKKNTSKTDPLLASIDYFQEIGHDFTIEKRFASRGSFHLSRLSQWSRTIMVGEAGGYQDYLFGFGMRMAMYSGLAAAYKLCGEFSHAHRINNELNLKRKISFANRVLFEQLSPASVHYWVERFHSNKAPLNILRRAYDWNWRKLVQSNKIIDHYAVRFS